MRLGLVLPLIGLTVAWVSLMVASFLDLGINFYTSTGYPEVVGFKMSTYVVLAGLAIASGLALWGFKLADSEHLKAETPLVRATYRFTGLTIVLALAFDVIFAFTTFVSSFNTNGVYQGNPPTLLDRFLGVYLPIILVAGLIVFVLLQATLFRKSSTVTETEGMSETQKALAIGYALPIIGTALAVIIGIAVFDAQRTTLQTWTWFVILLLVGTSIVFGTRFSAKAKLAKPVVRAPRVVGAAGAVTLNYVLSVVFAGVVSIMSFVLGTGAVSSLANQYCDGMGNCNKSTPLAVTADWWINQMIPAFLLLVLVEVATYLVITSRNRVDGD